MTMPTPRIQRFEKVLVINDRMGVEYFGIKGTVIWRDRPDFNRRTGVWREWAYSIYFPKYDSYCSFLESDLKPTGNVEAAEIHLGRRFEISYDIVMAEEMDAVEGCYRLPAQFWQGFAFFQRDVIELRHVFVTWESGLTGIVFDVPKESNLNREFVVRSMSKIFGSETWSEVRGPAGHTLK